MCRVLCSVCLWDGMDRAVVILRDAGLCLT